MEKKLSISGANLLLKTLKKLSVQKNEFKKQDDSKVTYARKISKDEAPDLYFSGLLVCPAK